MPPHAVPVTLTASERKILKRRAHGAKTPYRDRERAQIVLAAARGRPNRRIAADLGISEDKVRRWRGRFAACGLDGLKDLPRPPASAVGRLPSPRTGVNGQARRLAGAVAAQGS